MTLAIIGLGYVGLPLAVEFAKRRDVIGIDTDAVLRAAGTKWNFLPFRPDLRNSRVIDIIRELQDYGVRVIAEDPYAQPDEVAHEYPGVELGRIDPEHPVDALVVAVGHDVYAARDAPTLRTLLRGEKPVLADVKSLYDRHALAEAGITVWRL